MMSPHDTLLSEQLNYYRARASEYDEWFLRQGRFDHGADENARWFAEATQVADALDATLTGQARQSAQAQAKNAGLDILEIAGGTGIWTERLQRHAARLTVVDGAAEMLALNRQRVAHAQQAQLTNTAQPALATQPTATSAAAANLLCQVEYVEADLFAWRPARRYDLVFFGFWLSHVPPERFDAFWALVADCLAPHGRAYFVDSSYTETSTARDHQLEGPTATTLTRRLNAGQEYRIVKVFYEPAELTARLATLDWRSDIQATPTYFLYGDAAPSLA